MNGIASAQSSPGLILLGIAALVAVRLFYYDRSEDPEDALHLAMNVVGRTMIATGVVEGCLFLLSWFSLLLAGAGVVAALVAHWRFRANRRAALLLAMASAADKFMPLGPAAEAFASEWRGSFRRRTRRLARLLDGGAPLSEALRQADALVSPAEAIFALLFFGPLGMIYVYVIAARGLVSRKALSIIDAGQEAGVLSGAIGEAARQSLPRESLAKASLPIWYLVDMLFVAVGVVGFIMIKIVPAFIKIFEDFDAGLPRLTILLIQAADYFANYFYIALPFVLLLVLAAFHFAMRYFGLSTWDPPLIAGIARRLDVAAVLRLLAVAAAAERPLEPALAAFARTYPNDSLRRRLRRVRDDVTHGADCWESFHVYGLINSREAAMLKTAERVGNLPWMLGETSASIERKFAYRLQIVSQFAMPAAVLAFGGLVFTVVVGLFLPIVALIEKLL